VHKITVINMVVNWVGLNQLFGGLGWVWADEMDP